MLKQNDGVWDGFGVPGDGVWEEFDVLPNGGGQNRFDGLVPNGIGDGFDVPDT